MIPVPDPMSLSNSDSIRDEVRRRFLAACSGDGEGPPPDVEAFIAEFDEPERSELRQELQRIRDAHSGQSSAPNGVAGKATTTDHAAGTKRNEPAPENKRAIAADGTVELLPDNGTVDQAPASDGTVDHVSQSERTVDHVSTPDGTVDHVSKPDGTVDHLSAEPSSVGATAGSLPKARRASEQRIPETVAGYEIISVLGRGAMGVVYKARQRGLKRLVALKMILSGEHASENDLNRFRAEANAVAQLQHPGIIQIYEVGEDDGRPFFSLEFVDGVSLHQKIQGTPLPPREAATILLKMAEAMAYAHSRGVIHRDLKPANVLMTSSGEPKIGDFGLAKRLEDDESGMTRTGTVLGTPSYMSPEQASGMIHEVGPLADVYSLGAVLYDLLTGRPPFRGTSVMDTLQQLRTREPVPPVQLQPSVARDLETICLKCLQKDPVKRYADAGALAADLKRFLDGKPILARPVSRFERAWRWCRRNPGKATAIAAALVGVLSYAVSVSVLAVMLDQKKKEADRNRNDAVIAKGLAEQRATEANIAREISQQNEERQRKTATVSLQQMVETVGKLHDVMQSKRLSIDASPEIRKLRADVLKQARESLALVGKEIQAAATVTFADQYAAQLLGDLLKKLGHAQDARQMFEYGRELSLKRLQIEPGSEQARANLGIMEQRLGEVAIELYGDARTAIAHFEEAKRLHEPIDAGQRAVAKPLFEIHRDQAHDDLHLGRAFLALGQAAQAQRVFKEALGYYVEWERADPKSTLAPAFVKEAHMCLGAAALNLNDPVGAEEYFSTAVKMGHAQMERGPKFLTYKVDQVEVESAYADALIRLGRFADAEKHLMESMRFLRFVMAQRPDDSAFQPLLALVHEQLAIVSKSLNKPAEAKDNREKALAIRNTLFEVDRSNWSRQAGLVLAWARMGDFAHALPNARSIRPRMEKSPEFLLQLARAFTLCAAAVPADRKKLLDEAIATLVMATRDGYKDTFPLETDPELAALRDEQGFKDLIAKIKAR